MDAPAAPFDERGRLAALLARCYDDPDLFNTAILKRPKLWWRQVEIGRSIVANRDTVVYSGNSIGKDYFVGGLVPWWLWTRKDSLCIVTGASQTLIGSVTWKEIRRAIEGARFPMGAKVSRGIKTSPQIVELAPGWQALGFSTTSVERASGQHARKILVIVEEASARELDGSGIWEALDGLKYTRLLAIGNPIRPDGVFVDRIRQAARDAEDGVDPSRRVHAIRIPSTDSPHAHLDESPYGLADKTWLEAMARRYGIGSLWWRSHVEAEIPAVGSERLLPDSWLDWAVATIRLALPPGDRRLGRRRLGIDLGEGTGRDASSLVVRDDLGILEVIAGTSLGLAEAAAEARKLRGKWQMAEPDITYDRLGIGKDFANHLYREGIRGATPYHGNGTARNKAEFTNLRSEAAWNFRRRLDPEFGPDRAHPKLPQVPFHIPAGPWWPALREDLEALTYDLVGKQTRLIPKEALLEKLGRSPDRGDALLQTFAFP